MTDLTWHRSGIGSYTTEDPIGDHEFVATAVRVGSEWHLMTYTFGRVLTSEFWTKLADAKASASLSLHAIGG